MLITFQHPIIDFRSLYDDNYKLSMFPFWPIAEDNVMIKYFGVTKKRLKGGSINWSGEHLFCTSKKAIKFQKLENHKILVGDCFLLKTEGAFRRLNGDGNFLSKLEFGFTNSIEDYFDKIQFHENSFEKLLSDYCNLEIQIRNPLGKEIISNTSNCGKAISDLFLYASSYSNGIKGEKLNKCWTIAGEPLCILEYNDYENKIMLPKGAKLIVSQTSPSFELYHYWTYLPNNKRIRTWIIKKKYFVDYFDFYLRDLRLNLLRINAEKETVKKVLGLLKNKGNEILNSTDKINIVGDYLEKTSSKLLKKIRYGIKQEIILDFALSVEGIAQPGEFESYLDVLTTFKNRYVNCNIERIINRGTTINIDGGEGTVVNVTEKGNIINYGNKSEY